MKKFFKILGIIFAILIVVVIGLFITLESSKSDIDKTAKPYIKTNIEKIATWDYTKFDSLLTEEAKKSFQTEKGKKVLKFFSKLGKAISFEEPEFKYIQNNTNSNQDIIIYTVKGIFEKGDAIITLTLNYQESSYKIKNININSDVFLD